MSVTLQSRKNRLRLLSDSSNTVRFTVNGVVYVVGSEIPSGTRLVDFIRDYVGLKGTKYMCREGGCGACTVSVTSSHPITGVDSTYSVNSCLVLIHMCNGWAITTVEGLGSKKKGYHDVQTRLAAMNGSQCGYCSPGMVMAMHSFLEGRKHNVSQKEVEGALGGNICRCTGFRPILDAFQSFSFDASENVQRKCQDIEDLMGSCKLKTNLEESDDSTDLDTCLIELALTPQNVQIGGTWYIVNEVREIFEIFDGLEDNQTYMLVGGNTAYGAYRPRAPVDVYIEIRNVKELRSISVQNECVHMGSATTLTEAMDYFETISKTNSNFEYMRTLKEHLDEVAHYAVRNIGTIGGNLSIKHEHREFPSDVFLLLEVVGATITIRDTFGLEVTVVPEEYLNIDMRKKMITSITFNPLIKGSYVLQTYKVTPRVQNAHAIVNAGFLFSFDPTDNLKRVIQVPRVVFGGINPNFVHARRFENSIVGKQLLNEKDFQSALSQLSAELITTSYTSHQGEYDGFLPEPEHDPVYRKNLAMSLVYKFALDQSSTEIKPTFRSGAKMIHRQRAVSKGTEDYETKKKLWPLTKPMPKIDAIAQCSGEAQYTNDIPHLKEEYFAAVVLADRGPATIQHIDTTQALAYPGVHAFVHAKDIPGENIAIPAKYPLQIFEDEKLFAENTTEFAGQIIGAIIANDFKSAYEAANLVKVVYSDQKKPKIDIKEIIKDGDKDRITKQFESPAVLIKPNVQVKIKGTAEFGPQYHYTMEGQTALAIPSEDGMDIYAATQWVTLVQESVAGMLGLPNNRVNVKTRRVGGGYGAKLSRSCYPALIAAVCANTINKPVRIVMSIESMTGALGARYPIYAQYEAGVDRLGIIQNLNVTFNVDKGWTTNEHGFLHVQFGLGLFCIYDNTTYHVVANSVRTDVPTYGFTRSPGVCEATAFIEHVMDHIATAVKRDPVDVRIVNMKMPQVALFYSNFRATVEYDVRRKAVEEFNKVNRWRKKGISHMVTLYPLAFYDVSYAVLSVYRRDGTVAITTSGIEIGQGLHTKVAQAAAYELGIPVEKIAMKAAQTNMFPNAANTGGSTASDNAARCILLCCKELKLRLAPYLLKDRSWEKAISDAFELGVNLQVTKCISAKQTPELLVPYTILTSGCTEVEVDLLTGQHEITRVDILEDAGQSINPLIDIGQIQGAYMMGIGLWTTEHQVRDKTTGALLTNRTWNYKPPGAKDIPVDFRVSLLKSPANKIPGGAYGAKAVGEPPLQSACAVMFAIKQALRSARDDAGLGKEYFDMAAPFTVENIFLHSGIDPKKFTFK
uniref:Indole-3-acetaldehyde oxidase n=1 Tax=Cacopsylla melanoneura TaxID=428564 RepID=A0A8D9F6H1_9HEMI